MPLVNLKNPKARAALYTVAGALLGVVIGWCCNAAMVEISINAIFALYFGFFFLFLGGVITWRVMTFAQAANKNALLFLSGLMAVAGLICVFYQRHWFFSLSAGFRVPIYTILGTSLSFSLSFAIAELLNYSSASGIPATALPQRAQSALVQTPKQVLLLAAASAVMGFLYGLIFGFAEVGKGVFTLHTLRSQFIHEERLCLPVGALIGATTGYLMDKWRPSNTSGGSGSGKGGSGGGAGGAGGGSDSTFIGFGAEAGSSSSSSSSSSSAAASGAHRSTYRDQEDEEDDGVADFDPFQGSSSSGAGGAGGSAAGAGASGGSTGSSSFLSGGSASSTSRRPL